MKKLIWLSLAIALIIATTGTALMSSNDKIVWSPGVLEVTVFQGTTTTSSAQVVGPALSDTSLFVTPEIAKFLTIDSSSFASVVANQTYEFPLVVEDPGLNQHRNLSLRHRSCKARQANCTGNLKSDNQRSRTHQR